MHITGLMSSHSDIGRAHVVIMERGGGLLVVEVES